MGVPVTVIKRRFLRSIALAAGGEREGERWNGWGEGEEEIKES